jgi:hypothetical protein
MNAILEIESTKAKAKFAALPAKAQAADVAITRHGRIQAYLLSPERYAHLAAVDKVGGDVLRNLDGDLNALVARMQSATHARAAERIASAPIAEILAASAKAKPARKARPRKPSV